MINGMTPEASAIPSIPHPPMRPPVKILLNSEEYRIIMVSQDSSNETISPLLPCIVTLCVVAL
jgi:hypothetical protein